MTSAILVITGERNWTHRAIHLAGAMAHEASAAVIILRLVRVAHLEYLGTGAREALLSYEEFDVLSENAATAESYGVPVSVELFEYSDYTGGLLSAAELRSAITVFAPPPGGFIPAVARLRLWWLRRSLRVPLFTLGDGDGPLVWKQEPAEEVPATVTQPSVSLQ